MQEIKKIVVIGPESTGKSTICRLLAAHFDTLWCPEYARDYLLQYGTDYTFETLADIAKGQLCLEDKYAEKTMSRTFGFNGEATEKKEPVLVPPDESFWSHSSENLPATPLLFIDTDMHVMKVWSEYVFNKCHPFILDEIALRKYDLYLLCKPDIPWVKDELREYPDEKIRLALYQIYKDILINQNTPWVELTGDYDMRLQTAVAAVNACCIR